MRLLLLIIVFILLLCGSFVYINYNGGATSKKEAITLHLTLKDHRFIPDTIIAPENTPIYIKVYNQDPTVEEFESHDLKREKIVPPNSKITIRLAGLRPGKYEFYGEFHEKTALGQLIVKTEDEYKHSVE